MTNVDQAPQAPIEFERAGINVTGLTLTAAGSALAVAGVVGMDKYEAKVDSDAFMSVPIGERDNFITTADLPYIGSVALGASLAAVGIYKLFARKAPNSSVRNRSVSPDKQQPNYHNVHQPSE